MSKPVQINIDEVLRKEAPKVYKFLPKFVINYLKKVLHQDEINDFLRKNADKYGDDFVRETLKLFATNVDYYGINKIPKVGRYIFAGNHPLGGLDGVAFIHLIYKIFGDAKAIVNDLLLYLENLKPVFQGVNVFGKFSREQNLAMEELYKSDKHVIVFPSGVVSRKIKGKIQDLEWKKSFIQNAIKYKRDIIPVFIEGRNSNFFYNFAKFRKFIGIKFGVELIYLPDEMFNYRNKTITFYFGEPIPYNFFDKSRSVKEWAKYVRDLVYALPEKFKQAKQNN